MLKVTEFIQRTRSLERELRIDSFESNSNPNTRARISPVGCRLPVRHKPHSGKHQIFNADLVESLMHYCQAIERSFYENV